MTQRLESSGGGSAWLTALLATSIDAKDLSIGVTEKLYQASRLAWLYMTGKWPNLQIDYINRNNPTPLGKSPASDTCPETRKPT